jgi:Ca-activated chloride channel family protein
MLRGDPYLDKTFTWDSVIDLANGAKGKDAFGYRAEFIQLARLAKTAAAQQPLNPPGSGALGQ